MTRTAQTRHTALRLLRHAATTTALHACRALWAIGQTLASVSHEIRAAVLQHDDSLGECEYSLSWCVQWTCETTEPDAVVQPRHG